MREFTAYRTTAIPKRVTDLNYLNSLKLRKYKDGASRLDRTLENISNNIQSYNDPSGDRVQKFETILVGKKTKI